MCVDLYVRLTGWLNTLQRRHTQTCFFFFFFRTLRQHQGDRGERRHAQPYRYILISAFLPRESSIAAPVALSVPRPSAVPKVTRHQGRGGAMTHKSLMNYVNHRLSCGQSLLQGFAASALQWGGVGRRRRESSGVWVEGEVGMGEEGGAGWNMGGCAWRGVLEESVWVGVGGREERDGSGM